ncbi:MAG: MobF family relaxase, partial [Acidimicrobiales bacterium]
PAQVRAMLRSGELAGERRLGGWRVSDNAIDAYRQGRPQPPALGRLPVPGDDGTYALADAARIAGVHRSYLSRLLAKGAPETTVSDDGRPVQYLVGTRDERGHWRVSADELDRFVAGRVSARVVPAYDVAIRPPKSVSILHALGGLIPAGELAARGLPADVPAEVMAAHHVAVDEAVAAIERHAAWIRGPGGRVQATGLIVAAFDHRSSRMGDPLLHTHLVVANVARGVDGRMAALDGTALYAWAKAVGHLYQARLRLELTARLGVAFEQPHNGVADMLGVPRAVIECFSQRSRQRDALLARLGRSGARAGQAAVLASRPAKGIHPHQSPDELAARAAKVGFSPSALVTEVLGRGRALAVSPERAAQVATTLASPAGLTARATRVDLRDAICGFADALAEGARASQIESWATRLLHHGARFLPVVGPGRRRGDHIRRGDGRLVAAGGLATGFSTPELLAQEARLIAAHAEGLGADGRGIGAGLADTHALEAALAARPGLRTEQRTMVAAVTTSGIGIEVVVGGPGTGKTYALGAAAEAWRASGYTVVGACLQGGAAEILAIEAGLDHQYTLAGLLLRLDDRGPGFLAGSVVVVDEAGMADTRQLSRLATYAQAAGSKLVLVGDPDQIPEVGAGGAFAHLVASGGNSVVALRENHRQRLDADRQRLDLIRSGRSAAAIASARADGRWHVGESADDVRAALLSHWYGDPGVAGRDKLLVATTVAEVERLNSAARAMLLGDGHLGNDALVIVAVSPARAVDSRELRVGDRVRATRNDHARRVFTGMVGTVVGVDPEATTASVAIDAVGSRPSRTVELDSAFLHEREIADGAARRELRAPGLTHAYASTANAVQGRTSARAYVLVAEAGMHRQAAYVAASRASDATHFYALAIADPDELSCPSRTELAEAPDPDDARALAEAMARDASQTMASDIDPLAAALGQLIARPPAWLAAERAEVAQRLGGRATLAEALRVVRSRLADTYGLPLASLECRPLAQAMTTALQVPGATPERLAELMMTREHATIRELATASDPLAVLVWAAGEHARAVLMDDADRREQQDARPPAERQAHRDLEARLLVLDQAVSRQRDARLALIEHDPHGPVAALLGPPPTRPAGMVAWRRGARAIVEFRDEARLFDRAFHNSGHLEAADPVAAALGPEPAEAALAKHHREVLAIVNDSRAGMVVAELADHVPALGPRPRPAVAVLAEQPLPVLEHELATLRGTRRSAGRPLPVGASISRVEAIAHAREVADAIAVRRRRMAGAVLVDPPGWLRADVAHRVERGVTLDVARLARAYGAVAAESADDDDR